MSVADNMRIYEASRAVPKEAQKAFNNGSFSGTDINPMWRIKKLTEQFGACGIGWFFEVTAQEMIPIDDEIITNVNINLYIRDGEGWSKPIFGTGANKFKSKTKSGCRISDEGYKMALTDALSVACKHLGIGADIYFSGDKSSKYAAYYTDGKTPTPSVKPSAIASDDRIAHLKDIATDAQITWMLKKYDVTKLEELSALVVENLIKQIEERNK